MVFTLIPYLRRPDKTPIVVDGGGDERGEHVVSRLVVRLVRTDAEDVRAVVPAGNLGFGDRVAESRADALEAVRGHGHADAGAAHEHAEFGIALGDGHGHVIGVIGIIAGLGVEATVILAILESGHELGLEFESAVIGTDGNLHLCEPFVKFPRIVPKAARSFKQTAASAQKLGIKTSLAGYFNRRSGT